jgi:putative ABC transport system permease protein
MTGPLDGPSETRPAGGGVAARRAILRWSWRLFRREWRQQLLVLSLLTVVVGTTVVAAAAAYNLAGAPDDAIFGTATRYLRWDVADPAILPADLAAAEAALGPVDAVLRQDLPIPGSVDSLELRAQDPDGPHAAPMLALRDGRYPVAPSEVAITDEVAATFALDIGVTFSLGGHSWSVVGLVENPSDLADEFALLAAGTIVDGAPTSVTLLVDAPPAELSALRLPSSPATIEVGERAEYVNVIATVAILVVAAVALMLVALVAVASFVVVAQRRLRQFGMLAAVGATERHLRLVTVASGALVGIAAATVGTALGAGAWIAAVPLVEPAVGHRIEALNLPWWLLATALLLAVLAATVAAWWPARVVARVPVVAALSGRPPRPTPTQNSSALATVLVLAGAAALLLGDPAGLTDPTAEPVGRPRDLLLIGGGIVAAGLGVLLAAPALLQLAAATAARLPVPPRLALRDLARYRSRSAAALAAIGLALGIAFAIVLATSAAEHSAEEGNLSTDQLILWTRDADAPEGVSPYFTVDPNDSGFSPFLPDLTAADLAERESAVRQLAESLGAPIPVTLKLVFDPAHPASEYGELALTLAREDDDGYLDVALVFLATPELLRLYDLDPADISLDVDILTTEAGDLFFPGLYDPTNERFVTQRATGVTTIEPTYSAIPGSLMTERALQDRGWDTRPVGWLIDAPAPLTPQQLAQARDAAAATALLVESRQGPPNLANVRNVATGAGVVVALAVLAMTVGLIRGEAAADLATLTAVGAAARVRRVLAASTAAALAILGVALGAAGAYLIALTLGGPATLIPVPAAHLAAIALGVPLLAALAAYLASREPPTLVRRLE